MNPTFKSYNSLDNATQSLINNAILFNNTMWCAREKIHGTNYQMVYDGNNFISGTRNDYLQPLSNFYNSQDIDSRYKNKIIALYNAIKPSDGKCVVVYGEYAGTLKSGKKIQKQIDYGDSDFYVFDIGVRDIELSESDKIDFIDDDKMELLCTQVGLKTAPLLGIGLPSEIFKITSSFISVVNEMNAGEDYMIVECKDPDNENLAEGYVAKPIKSVLRPNGKRVIIKCKNSKFKEKGESGKIKVVEMSENDNNFINEFIAYITENRLRNVLSKTGVPLPSDFPKIAELLFVDAISDYDLEHDVPLLESSSITDDYGRCINVIKNNINSFIRPNWVSIFNGEF